MYIQGRGWWLWRHSKPWPSRCTGPRLARACVCLRFTASSSLNLAVQAWNHQALHLLKAPTQAALPRQLFILFFTKVDTKPSQCLSKTEWYIFSANMQNFSQQQAMESLHQPLTGISTCPTHTPLWRAQWAHLCHWGEGRAGIPNQTAMHRVTLLASNRKKMTELAKETTCTPGGRAANSARKAPTGKAKLKMRWRHYRNFRFLQNKFPEVESQKFTYRIILKYFTPSHCADRSNCLFAAQNQQWKS